VEQPGVGADRIALAEEQDVTWHHVVDAELLLATVAQHASARRGHALERRDRCLRLALLEKPEDAVPQHDQRDDDRLDRRPMRSLEEPRHERDDDRREQQVDQRICELGDELAPGRRSGLRVQPVGTDTNQPCSRLRRGKAQLRVAAERAGNVGAVAQRGIADVEQVCRIGGHRHTRGVLSTTGRRRSRGALRSQGTAIIGPIARQAGKAGSPGN
jgi:hypothetical protein